MSPLASCLSIGQLVIVKDSVNFIHRFHIYESSVMPLVVAFLQLRNYIWIVQVLKAMLLKKTTICIMHFIMHKLHYNIQTRNSWRVYSREIFYVLYMGLLDLRFGYSVPQVKLVFNSPTFFWSLKNVMVCIFAIAYARAVTGEKPRSRQRKLVLGIATIKQFNKVPVEK